MSMIGEKIPDMGWAAALVDPSRAGSVLDPARPVDGQALISLLRKHKVPLLSLASGPLAGRLEALTPAWSQALAEERREFAAQRAEFATVQAALEAVQVAGILIKAVGIPPSLPYRSDNLDLLVHREDAQRARRALEGLGYVELRNVEEPAKFLFRRFVAGRSMGAVHLHECVGWGTGFMDEEGLWWRARSAPDDPALTIPGPTDALLITIAHAFYEDKRFTLGDLQRVLWCLRREAVDWDVAREVTQRRGWYPGLVAAAALLARAEETLYGQHSWPSTLLGAVQMDLPVWAREGLGPLLERAAGAPPWRVPFAYSKRHYFYKVRADRSLPVGQKVVDALKHSAAGVKRKLRVRSQRPFLIALHGIDGSGKTAHAEALVAAFQTCDLRVRRSWSRLASSPLSGRILAWARRLTGQRGGASGVAAPQDRLAARRRQIRSPLLRAGFVWLTALDLWLQYLGKVAWPLWRGEVVVADRYVLDAVAELGQVLNHPAPESLWAMRLLRFFSPRPDRAYLLEVPPSVAAGRAAAPEAADLLAEQAALRRVLAARWQVEIVNNHRPFADTSAELASDALRRYYRTFWTVRNMLFMSNPQPKRAGD